VYSSITEQLKHIKLKNIERSIKASEQNEISIREKSRLIKPILGTHNPVETLEIKAYQLSVLYYEMKARYDGKATFTKVATSDKSKDLWRRVAVACDKAGAEPRMFMKAQYDFFHTAFGTIPKLNQLATEGATTRAQLYAGNDKSIVGNAMEHKISVGSLFSYCEKQIQDICKAQNCNREEFYQRFVLTRLLSFPKQFLESDPVYRKLV
jgi:hypothetical protein